MMELFNLAADAAVNPKHSRWVANCLVAGEAVLCSIILFKVPYTEIDWTTYMQQVKIFIDGETDYRLIKGDTGPLVYPALHLYLYSGLYYLTEQGTNIFRAQCIFALLYLTTVAVVMSCYRRVGAPPWLLLPLVLSKRLHSIFLLRLFNDAWAALFLWLSIWGLQKKWWNWGAVTWGMGLGIKMTILLSAPALATITLQGAGTAEAFILAAWVFIMQACAAFPFFIDSRGPHYFFQAFDFGRQFLFNWTVNWRFVGEKTFLSQPFAVSLMVLHVTVLLYFLQTRWVRPSSSNLLSFVRKYTRTVPEAEEHRISQEMTPLFVMDAMLTSVAIGMLCARSLHYQFYAYLGWATPYLLWRAGAGPIWVLVNCAVQEVCWLKFPSTNASSALVVAELAVQVIGVLRADSIAATAPKTKVVAKKQ